MKFINLCHYIVDLDRVATLRPAHRKYMAELDAQGQLWAAGPLTSGLGALFIYESPNVEAAEDIFRHDPYFTGGVIQNHELAAWDAALYNAPPLTPNPSAGYEKEK